ncbi:hypothetical protein RKD41_003760 [Streptomyces tendae]
MRVRDGQGRVRVERQPPGDELEQHDADRVQIGAGVHAPAEGLLRREVLRGADDHAGLRHRRHAGLHGARDAEVHDLDDAALVQHDVARLDVAVDQAHLVADLQRGEHVRGDLQRLVGGHRAGLPHGLVEDGAERTALDVLHDDVRRRHAVHLVLAGVEDGDDVGVRELGHCLGLTAEPLTEGRLAAQLGVQRLDRDLAVEHGVVGEVDGGHAALAEQVAQLVAATGQRPSRVRVLCAVLAHVLRPPCPLGACGCRDPMIPLDPMCYSRPSLPHGTDRSSEVPVP